MAIPIAGAVPIYGNPYVDVLTQGGAWVFPDGNRTLTYSLNLNDPPTGTWDATWSAGVAQALAAWSSVANVRFLLVPSGTYVYESTSDLAFALMGTDLREAGAYAISFFPDPGAANTILAAIEVTRLQYPRPEGDVLIDNYYVAPPVPGSFTFSILMHEIGHALGLKHWDDNGLGGHPTVTQVGLGALPGWQSMMGSGLAMMPGVQPVTPMLLDILAIQTIYGPNWTYNTGNDTYAPQAGVARAIWDAGGVDTVDLSAAVGGFSVALEEGSLIQAWSGPSAGQLVIAYGVQLENATGSAGADQLSGNAASNTLDGRDGDDFLYGLSGNDLLLGGYGNDVLDGGAGADAMSGGPGNDSYFVDQAGDTIVEAAGEGADTVTSAASMTLGDHLEGLTLAGTESLSATGNALANTLRGNAGNNVLNGLGGTDVLMGGAGDDTYVLGDTFDPVMQFAIAFSGPAGEWITQGQTYAFSNATGRITAYAADGADPDTLVDAVTFSYDESPNGTNWFYFSFYSQDIPAPLAPGTYVDPGYPQPGFASLSISGNGRGASVTTGSFTVSAAEFDYSGAPPQVERLSISFVQYADGSPLALTGTIDLTVTRQDLVVEAAGAGTDTVVTPFTYALPPNVENLHLTGADAVDGTGNALDNVLLGNSGVNVLTGGLGNDTYGVDNAGDTVVELAGEGVDTIRSTVAYSLAGTAVENLTLLGSADIAGTGNALANVILGNAGINVLAGGPGDDTYGVDNAADTVIENPGEGIDTIRSSIPYSLAGSAVENLVLLGAGNLAGSGGSGDNVLTGNAGENTFRGGGGNDIVDGAGGLDTLILDSPRSSYAVTYAGGRVTVSGPGESASLRSVESLEFGSGETQNLASFYLGAQSDATGDGRADIYWRHVGGAVALWEMNGPTMVAGSYVGQGGIPTDWRIADTGDFNGDGHADLAWRHDGGAVALWMMDGPTVLGATMLGTIPVEWRIAGTGDFDGDGTTDLLWRHADGTVGAWLMQDGAAREWGAMGAVGNDWSIAGTGDFDASGTSDILWRHASGQVAIWTLNGVSLAGGTVVATVGTDWTIAGTGDFDASGSSDILWRHAGGAVATWLIENAALADGGIVGAVGNDWRIASSADYDGDLHADILWRHDSGAVAEWYVDGYTLTGGAMVATVPMDWLIV